MIALTLASPAIADERDGPPSGVPEAASSAHRPAPANSARVANAVRNAPRQQAARAPKPAQAPLRATTGVRAADGAPDTRTAMLESLPTVKLRPPIEKTTMQIRTESAQMELIYIDGLVAQSRGDDRGAHLAFLQAAEAGYAPAQRKLGEIYDKGNTAVRRDFATSIRWYQRARDQGENIPTPHTLRVLP